MIGDQTLGSSYYELDIGTNQRTQAIARNTAQVWATSPAELPVTDDTWHHLAAVYTSPTLRTLHLDGVPVATSTTSVPFVASTTRFSISALMRNSPTQAFAGYLDDIGLWNIALSKEHLALIHALGRHSRVGLDDPAIDTLLAVHGARSGFAAAGGLVWQPAAGLSGSAGTSGIRDGQPFVVLGVNGDGLVALSKPELRPAADPPGGDIMLEWHAGFGDWLLQESPDLRNWSASPRPVTDSGLFKSVTITDPEGEPRFFRLTKP